MNWRAVFYALASAALFGISTPAAKVLLGSMHPAVLAGLLYCGAGIGVALLRWLRLHSLSTSDVPEFSTYPLPTVVACRRDSRLTAGHTGALLYPRVGYERFGTLFLFAPRRTKT